MSNPVKQHYVPQSYLRNFCNKKNKLFVYLKIQEKIIEQIPRSTAYQNHFYTLTNEGTKDYTIEKILAEQIDVLYQPVITKLQDRKKLTEQDKYNLLTFVAFQYLRTPSQRDNLNRMLAESHQRMAELIFSHKKKDDSLTDWTVRQIEEGQKNSMLKVDVENSHSINFMFEFADDLIRMLGKHDLFIIDAPKKSEFITSDNPYCMIKEKWCSEFDGYGVINTVKIFPLTPKILLMLRTPKDLTVGHGGFKRFKFNSGDVKSMNHLIADWSFNFIYAKNDHVLKSIIKELQ